MLPFRTEVDIAITRPPGPDLTVYGIISALDSIQAELIACQIAVVLRPDCVMAVASRSERIPDPELDAWFEPSKGDLVSTDLTTYEIDVEQDHILPRYAFKIYRLEDNGQRTFIKRSGPRYYTPAGANRRGKKWLAKQVKKGKLS